MTITVREIAKLVDGKIFGDEASVISSVSNIKEASKNDLTFIYRSDYAHLLKTTEAKVVLINQSIEKNRDVISENCVILENVANR